MPFRLKKCKCNLLAHNDCHISWHDALRTKRLCGWYTSEIERWEEHVKVFRKVFERCRLFILRINPWKCAFGMSAGKFLGFLVHNRGIDMDLAKVVAIATMKPPATVKELKSFLGKVSHIRRFIPGLASITSAFMKLLKKWQGFKWGKTR